MKKNAIIITFAAALCALTSCSKEVGSLPDMAVSPADSTSAVAISAGTELAAKAESSPVTTTAAMLEATTAATTASEAISEDVQAPAVSETVQNNATVYNGFKSSTVNGNVYTSEYAGIKITLPEDANFLDVDNLHTHYIMPTRFMSEDEKSFYMTGELDASACYGYAVNRVDVWFYNTKQRYPSNPDMSAEEFLKTDEMNFDPETEVSDVAGPEYVKICGKDYVKVSYTAFSQPHITYARRIDAEHIMEIRTAGLTAEDFESRIFEISLCRQFFSL